MDRRDTLKSLLLGSFAGSVTFQACAPDVDKSGSENVEAYGRTPEEAERDRALQEEVFFNTHELATIAVLCDILLPATTNAGSATDAGVPEFIEFIAKDIKDHQLPLRGGLMWLDAESNARFDKTFINCSSAEQMKIIDDIAFPEKAEEHLQHGVQFFNKMRDLTLTGYYTSKMGFEDLGYRGNTPNIWDGVPQEVLDKHGLAYDPEWLEKCVDQSKRNDVAQWDDQGNLLT